MTTREQPVRAPTGLPYGEKQKLEQAQQAIPLPAQPSPGGGQPQEAPVERPEVFAPTARPGEPLTAGAAAGPGPQSLELLPPDPVAHLRALYQRFPHEDLRRLLERASENAASAGTAAPQNQNGATVPPQTPQAPQRRPTPAPATTPPASPPPSMGAQTRRRPPETSGAPPTQS